MIYFQANRAHPSLSYEFIKHSTVAAAGRSVRSTWSFRDNHPGAKTYWTSFKLEIIQ